MIQHMLQHTLVLDLHSALCKNDLHFFFFLQQLLSLLCLSYQNEGHSFCLVSKNFPSHFKFQTHILILNARVVHLPDRWACGSRGNLLFQISNIPPLSQAKQPKITPNSNQLHQDILLGAQNLLCPMA